VTVHTTIHGADWHVAGRAAERCGAEGAIAAAAA